jgi:hypothetical protein
LSLINVYLYHADKEIAVDKIFIIIGVISLQILNYILFSSKNIEFYNKFENDKTLPYDGFIVFMYIVISIVIFIYTLTMK